MPRAGCSADACQQSAAQLMRRRGRGSAKTQWRLQNQASVSTHTSTTTDRPHTIRITKNKRLTPNGGGVGRVENIMGTGVRRPRPEEEPTPGARSNLTHTSAKVKSQANSRYAWKSRRTRRTLSDLLAHSSMPPEGERARPREIGDARSPTRPLVAQIKHNTSLRATRRRARVRRAPPTEFVLLRLLAPDDLLPSRLQRSFEVDRTPPLLELLEVRPHGLR